MDIVTQLMAKVTNMELEIEVTCRAHESAGKPPEKFKLPFLECFPESATSCA